MLRLFLEREDGFRLVKILLDCKWFYTDLLDQQSYKWNKNRNKTTNKTHSEIIR